MIPDSVPETDNESPGERAFSAAPSASAGLVIGVLALGIVVGLAMGWISFGSPESARSTPPALYDEELVTSVYEDASGAVVGISVIPQPTGGLSRTTFREETGSGFLVDDAGHIVTNHHVVEGSGEITVQLFDGRTLPATKLGTSPADDLALLQVDPQEVAGIDPLPLADSDMSRPGQMAIAIGSPFGDLNSVTVGVVSGLGRSRPSVLLRPIPDLVQTDAALNPGNSGGPLLNSSGEVIGVNSSVRVVSSVQIGVGYAIPSNTLKDILPDLLNPGVVRRPWIGISGTPLTRNMSVSLALPSESGIYVNRVWDGSPAQKAGLRGDPRRIPSGQGDIIVAVDGNPVASFSDMVSYFNSLRPSDQVTLTILRDKETHQVDITLAEWPDT